jgi:predicted translin family RNA/ssDNA-binding protein
MERTRDEVDAMLRRADEARTKLRQATRELQRFGAEALAAREARRAAEASGAEKHPDDDRSR